MYTFGALLMRMNYINRWGLMRNARSETLSEHAVATAAIASILGYIAKEVYGVDVDPEKITCRALYHDAGEILNGDLPTPVKYRNETIRDAYKKLEAESEERILATLPEELQRVMRPLITGEDMNLREKQIVKTADKLAALVKCIEEEQSGNNEFASAKESTLNILRKDPSPETEYFPAYSLTLDELLKDNQ